jgi:hypothetical protein
LAYFSHFNALAKEGAWLQQEGVNLAVAGPRLLQQVHERRDKLKILARSAGTETVDSATFSHGVQVGLRNSENPSHSAQ